MDDKVVLKLRHDLANDLGVEKTPDEIRDILDRALAIFEILDLPTYRYTRDLGPGGCLMEAKKNGFADLNDFFLSRDILLYVGERKFPDEPKRTDKPFWKSEG